MARMRFRTESMSLEGWKTIFEIGGVILLFFTFIFGAGALFTGTRINARQASRLQEFDKQLTDAKTELGKQQERAANAEHDAADAKTISAKANERAQALEAEAANAKLSQQKVELEVGKQQERAANAERSLLELQRRVEPRRLSPEQRTRLIAALSSGPRGAVSVTCVLGDSDGCPFAEQIKEVLTASGWTDVDGVNQAVFGGGSPIGFGIIVRSAVTAPSYAGHLQQAFFSIGLPLGGVEKADAPEGVVQIIIGHKPN